MTNPHGKRRGTRYLFSKGYKKNGKSFFQKNSVLPMTMYSKNLSYKMECVTQAKGFPKSLISETLDR